MFSLKWCWSRWALSGKSTRAAKCTEGRLKALQACLLCTKIYTVAWNKSFPYTAKNCCIPEAPQACLSKLMFVRGTNPARSELGFLRELWSLFNWSRKYYMKNVWLFRTRIVRNGALCGWKYLCMENKLNGIFWSMLYVYRNSKLDLIYIYGGRF